MNKEAADQLKLIVVKELHELTESDISFLKARSGYLTVEEQVKFKKILSKAKPEESQIKIDDLEGMPLIEMSLEQLQVVAKHMNVKGAHLFKDIEKLREVTESIIKEDQRVSQSTENN